MHLSYWYSYTEKVRPAPTDGQKTTYRGGRTETMHYYNRLRMLMMIVMVVMYVSVCVCVCVCVLALLYNRGLDRQETPNV